MVLFATVIEIQMTAILSNADSDVREPVDPCNNSLTILFSQIKYIKVHTATRWTIRHSLKLHCILSLSSLAPINTITVPFFYQTRVILDAQHDLIASDILGQLESCCLLRLPGQSRASNSL